MSDPIKHELYKQAWHGDKPYDDKELVRLELACHSVREHAAELGLDRPYELLDLGCGVGPLRPWLGPEEFRITGLELSAEAAEAARANYDACEVCDVESPWPIGPASLDGVHAGAILEHVIDWNAPLNHANRCLRDAGLLVAAVPNLRHWKEIRKLIVGKQPHWIRSMAHLHAYTPRFLRELVTMHGFEVTRMEADMVKLPLLSDRWRWVRRVFAGIGSVLILTARLGRRVRVEDAAKAWQFPDHKRLGKRFIEVPS